MLHQDRPADRQAEPFHPVILGRKKAIEQAAEVFSRPRCPGPMSSTQTRTCNSSSSIETHTQTTKPCRHLVHRFAMHSAPVHDHLLNLDVIRLHGGKTRQGRRLDLDLVSVELPVHE